MLSGLRVLAPPHDDAGLRHYSFGRHPGWAALVGGSICGHHGRLEPAACFVHSDAANQCVETSNSQDYELRGRHRSQILSVVMAVIPFSEGESHFSRFTLRRHFLR